MHKSWMTCALSIVWKTSFEIYERRIIATMPKLLARGKTPIFTRLRKR